MQKLTNRWFFPSVCLVVIYSNILALNTRLFTRYVRRHPSNKINTKKLPEKLVRCLREPKTSANLSVQAYFRQFSDWQEMYFGKFQKSPGYITDMLFISADLYYTFL